ncbi:MAG TPA: quinohemoprotein amine dehydrogenase subunit alpha [Gemmatimonadaceae bacterium]|jgi:quinohemoprotein amine dehydrogenase|nr:quinohemoprotein amine dehydrogenase subunit alpha [Gemmatimonadaceae bacterium]
MTRLAGLALVALANGAWAQGNPPPAQKAAATARKDTTSGFAINDQVVIQNCSRCHVRDSSGVMQRLSYMRKTPEGWEISLRRMVALQHVRVDPATARAIIRYLSNAQGLAPAEARPARFESERRAIDYKYAGDARTEQTCHACHSLGRVISQRRTKDEWDLLLATHRAYYPLVDFQAFRRGGPPPPDSAGAPEPMDVAVAHLSKVFPLRTPDWAAWSATMRPARIEGEWVLSGTEPGRGAFSGRLTITPSPNGDDEFTTKATYRYARGGATVTRDGKAMVYTGFQWRGRSSNAGTPADSAWREVMFIEPGWQEISGRWFRGGYDEFGMDVSLSRLGAGPVIAGIYPRALKAGSRDQQVTVVGANLPRDVQAAALDFGPGVHVDNVVRADGDSIVARVAVDAKAPVGERDLFLAGASLKSAAVVYDRISRIKVTPAAGMARVGGAVFPKQFQQFEAIAYNNGADGKPDTEDDVEIGPVDVSWSLEEYSVTYDDDDIKYVGRIDQRGLFTPNLDGPNPQRSRNRNNVGDVWVVATYQDTENGQGNGNGTRPLKARALLLVTVPLYLRWEPWKGDQ